MKPENTASNPEALEALLASKSFDALTPKEQAYALEHVENAEEYASLRALLLTLNETPTDAPLKARSETKAALMNLFAQEEKGGFRVWLNGIGLWLLPSDRAWFRQPAYGLAFGSIAVLLVGWLVFSPGKDVEVFAEAHTAELTEETQPQDLETPTLSERSENATSNEVTTLETQDNSVQEEAVTQLNEDATPPPPALAEVRDQPLVAEQAVEDDFDLDFEEDLALEDARIVRVEEEEELAPIEETSPDLKVADAATKTDEATPEYTLSTQELDSQYRFAETNPVDQYMYNTTTNADIVQLESIAGTTVESTTATRGLDVTFEIAVVGESADAYKGVLELMVTEW